MDLVLRGHFARHAKAFTGPRTKVNVLAPFTAKRARRVGRAINTVATTGWANHNFDFGWVHVASESRIQSGAQGQLERGILRAWVQTVIAFMAHQAYRHHQTIAADFRNQAQAGVQSEAQ